MEYYEWQRGRPPEREGFYWFAEPTGADLSIVEVERREWHSEGRPPRVEFVVTRMGKTMERPLREFDGFFCGPIPFPGAVPAVLR